MSAISLHLKLLWIGCGVDWIWIDILYYSFDRMDQKKDVAAQSQWHQVAMLWYWNGLLCLRCGAVSQSVSDVDIGIGSVRKCHLEVSRHSGSRHQRVDVFRLPCGWIDYNHVLCVGALCITAIYVLLPSPVRGPDLLISVGI